MSGMALDGGPTRVFWKAATITQGTLAAPGMAQVPEAAAVLHATRYCVSRADPGGREKRLELAI